MTDDSPTSPRPDTAAPQAPSPTNHAPASPGAGARGIGPATAVAPEFHHAEAGTPESVWLASRGWDRARVVPPEELLAGVARLVVFAAHPDDETLGAGGLTALAAARGLPVDIVVATDGDASHPGSAVPPALLATLRRDESRAAAAALGDDVTVTFLGLGDGRLAEDADGLAATLRRLLADETNTMNTTGTTGTAGMKGAAGATLAACPWERDGHPDHDTLGAAARAACTDAGVALLRYPIWAWHWGRPDEFPWDDALVVPLDAAAAHAKHEALAAHATQVRPLVAGLDAVPLLGEPLLARHRRLVETFLVDPADPRPGEHPPAARPAAAPFDAMYDAGDDPWHDDAFYERRKRALVLACLRRERYGRVLEIGCATGTLGADLAARADAYVGLDVSGRALAVARARHAGDTVSFVHGSAPEAVPDGPFDLVVLSEVGYFLRADALLATLRAARRVLADGGEILLCHWRHPTSGIPLDGPLVHAQARTALDLPHRVAYRDDDVLLDAWGAGPSVAAADGLA